MKICVVSARLYAESWILGVYASRERAERIREERTRQLRRKDRDYEVEITEHELEQDNG